MKELSLKSHGSKQHKNDEEKQKKNRSGTRTTKKDRGKLEEDEFENPPRFGYPLGQAYTKGYSILTFQ